MPASAARQTLRASPAITRTVAGRQVQASLEATRSRIEREPGCGQSAALAAAEKHFDHGRLKEAGERLFEINQALDAREEAARTAARLAETERLNRQRGELQEVAKDGAVHVLSRDGMHWLVRKGRLTGTARLGAERYRALYERFHGGEVRISRMEGNRSGGGEGLDPARAKIEAGFDLDDAHHKALHQDGALKWLVEAVCGRGETLMDLAKGDKHTAARLETELLVACRLLAKHFKIG